MCRPPPLPVSLQCSSHSDPVKCNLEYWVLFSDLPLPSNLRVKARVLTKGLQDWASYCFSNLTCYQPHWFPCCSLKTRACSCLRASALVLQECSSATYQHDQLLPLPLFKSQVLNKAIFKNYLKLQNPPQHSLLPLSDLFSGANNIPCSYLSSLLFPTPECELHEFRDLQ